MMTFLSVHLSRSASACQDDQQYERENNHRRANVGRDHGIRFMMLAVSTFVAGSHGFSTPMMAPSKQCGGRCTAMSPPSFALSSLSSYSNTNPQRKSPKGKTPHPFLLLPQRSNTALQLLDGLETSVDDEIASEEADAALSPAQIAIRELQQSNSPKNLTLASAAFKQRMKDMSGDEENKVTLFKTRGYANSDAIYQKSYLDPPVLDDLDQKPVPWKTTLWVQAPFRLFVLVGTYQAFPYLATFFGQFITIDADDFQIISSTFVEGLGVLYGTFLALTLKILYERQASVQENSVREASLLSVLTQNLLSLFYREEDEVIARETLQIVADQVRMLIGRSRGAEILSVMRADPYSKILGIIDHYQKNTFDPTPQKESLIEAIRRDLPALTEARDLRLSQEASSLPSTHYVVLLLLTVLSLLAFLLASITETEVDGSTPGEARVLFMGLTAVYTLCYNFSKDLNDPFTGVFQIKRSSTASYLLQVKWLISNQPYGKYIRFDDRTEEEEGIEGVPAAVAAGAGIVNKNTSANDFEKKGVMDRWKSVIRSEMDKSKDGITEDMLMDISSARFNDRRPMSMRRKKRRRRRRR